MSKQARLILTVLIASIAIFAGLLQSPAGLSKTERFSARPLSISALAGGWFGQKNPIRPKSAAETTTNARNAALVAATEAVLKETSEIRQLPILRPVQSSTQTRAEIERMVIKNLEEDTTPAQMHASEVALKKLGLAPRDFDYRALMIGLLSEQVAGYYDPKTRDFHLADWIDLDGQKPIMAHELTHALQDQHFDLRRFSHWPKGDSDAELAAHALIEGDATLAMEFYMANNVDRRMAFVKSLGASGVVTAELDKAPRALRESLLFPYQEGEKWVKALYKRGGNWSEVSQAFTTLPQSTEQILHPEKYFAREAPVKVMLPDISALLNASKSAEVRGQRSEISKRPSETQVAPSFLSHPLSSQRAGWRRLDYDVEGEWGFYLILDQFLKAPLESRRAAAGWGGDRFAVYEGPKGESLFVSLSSWDTDIDAREFFDAYIKRTELRYPDAAGLASADSRPPTPDSRTFRTSEGAVVIELRGTRVLILEGVPERVDSKSLLRELGR